MRYEHRIRVNPLGASSPSAVTRAQLWAALVLRAEDPMQFMPALEAYCIRARAVNAQGFETLARTLDFGGFAVQDQATLAAPDALILDTQAGATWPASRLTLRIEEPEPEVLFLSFVYESDEHVGSELDAMADHLRRRAYEAADQDMVARIRGLVGSGLLGAG